MTSGGPTAADLLAALVRDVPDFPEPGIVFKDITPVLASPAALATVVAELASLGRDASGRTMVDKVAGIESRGFILGAPVALALEAGFVPVRKAGRLPRSTFSESYALEYGEATLEVHRDAFGPRDRVLVVDDVLATGGTMAATLDLVAASGATPVAGAVLIELGSLDGRSHLNGRAFHALLTA